MGRIIKWLFYLVVLGGIGLVCYAYVGPFLGADFSAPADEVRQEVILHAGGDWQCQGGYCHGGEVSQRGHFGVHKVMLH